MLWILGGLCYLFLVSSVNINTPVEKIPARRRILQMQEQINAVELALGSARAERDAAIAERVGLRAERDAGRAEIDKLHHLS